MVWTSMGCVLRADEFSADRQRLLGRAEDYLNSIEKSSHPTIPSYALIIRGLLKTGLRPNHFLLQDAAEKLFRMTPRNDEESRQLLEVGLLLNLVQDGSIDQSTAHHSDQKDYSVLRAEIASEVYQDNYRRFGVVCLPRGFNPNLPDFPFPSEHGSAMLKEHLLGTTGSTRKIERIVDLADILPSDFSLSLEADRHPAVSSEPTGYSLIAQTNRRRE